MTDPGAERGRGSLRPRVRVAAAYALVALLALAALGGVVRNGFVNYDDDLYVVDNPELSRGSGLDGLRWAFTTTRGGNWHPLTWISHLVDVRLFGLDPAAHHAMSLGIHTLNALLLLALLRGATGALWRSALVAALFAAHPLHVESVAWAAERKDVLSTFFALAAALAWVRGVRRPGGGAARAWPAAGATALYALALLSKPMPVSLPLLLLLLDWWPLGRWSPTPGAPPSAALPFARVLPPLRLWAGKAPLFALAAASAAVTWEIQRAAGALRAAADVPLAARAANAVVSYALYLRRTLWPDDLAVFYPYPWDGQPPLAVAPAAALLAALAALAVRTARRQPWVPAGLLWFFVALLPVIGLVQAGEQALADRYTYLPLAGVFLAAAWWLAALAQRGARAGRVAIAAGLAVVTVLGVLAARQVRTWRDGEALFSRALAVTRDNHIAHNNLGTELLRQGRAAEAVAHFEETIRLAPGSSKGYQNLGRALAHLGRDEEAAGWFQEASVRDPGDPLPQLNLARSLERLGRRGEAITAWRQALALQPGHPQTLDALGVALARAGQAQEAVPLLAAAAALAPGDESIRTHLAVARAQLAAVTPQPLPPPPRSRTRSAK